MLILTDEGPKASGLNHATDECTDGFIDSVRKAVRDFWERRSTEVKRACAFHMPLGSIDEMDVLAFVLADALGQPLLHPDDTNKFGKRVASKAARVHDALKAQDARTEAAVRRAKEAAARDSNLLPRIAAAAEAGAEARAQLLAKPYDPKPPQSTVGTKRKQPEPEPTPTPSQALVEELRDAERIAEARRDRARADERAADAAYAAARELASLSPYPNLDSCPIDDSDDDGVSRWLQREHKLHLLAQEPVIQAARDSAAAAARVAEASRFWVAAWMARQHAEDALDEQVCERQQERERQERERKLAAPEASSEWRAELQQIRQELEEGRRELEELPSDAESDGSDTEYRRWLWGPPDVEPDRSKFKWWNR